MNVKNLAGNAIINTLPSTQQQPETKAIKSENTHDRDANGQQLYQKQQKKKEKMTREQAEKAIANLNAKHFMLDMKWVAVLVEDEGYFYAEVKDQSQNLIRKIAEHDLWEVFETPTNETSQKGNLLKRTA
ncbi:hypothetical protein [Pseudobdellovibrio sp. HCB154]|uniref:hypothetical protein n=1 Tax=Pseudobdellovibrio sp. HCB154 TaxID=3386277 RepID=UPI00391708D2